MNHTCRRIAIAATLGALLLTLQPLPAAAQQLVIGRATVDVKLVGRTVTATISWFTTASADGRVDYGATTAYGSYVASSITDIYHEVVLSNLASETTYHFKLTSATPTGERLESFDQTFKTQKFIEGVPPTITEVHVSFASATYAVVTWRTDEKTDAKVEYATNPELTRPSSVGGTSNTTEHEAVLRRLTAGTTYYYRVRSRDKNRNEGISGMQTFSTGYDLAAERELLAIRQVSPVSFPDPAITDTAVTFTWKTTRPAKGYVDLRGIRVSSKRVTETGFSVTEHQVSVTGLKPASRYVAKIYAKDVLGKSLTTGEIYLTTDPSKPPTPKPAGTVSGVSCSGPYVYGVPCRDLAAEQNLARELRSYLRNVFSGQVPAAARQNWFTLVNAFTYGGYPTEALVQAVKYSGKTVHPTVPWSEWKSSRDYQAYIKKP